MPRPDRVGTSGLAALIRVVDHRQHLLDTLPDVELYLQSETTANELLASGFDHVVVATGSRWRSDGVGRSTWETLDAPAAAQVLTPDDLMDGVRPEGDRVVLYDDDHYYMGGVLAELPAREGFSVELVTPAAYVSEWSINTMEATKVRRRLLPLGVTLTTQRCLLEVVDGGARTRCVDSDDEREHPAAAVVLVTAQEPLDSLAVELEARRGEWADAGIRGVHLVGDCRAPGTIAAAVWSGRSFAERLEADGLASETVYRRELTQLAVLEP